MKTILTLIFCTFLLSAYAPENVYRTESDRECLRINFIENSSFTPELFIEYMNLIGVVQIRYSFAMSRLETGNFTSFIFENNYNLFGMRHPSVRPTFSKASIYKHAFYSHWTESVKDYKLWQDYLISHDYDLSDYPKFLKQSGYSTSPEYVKLVKRML